MQFYIINLERSRHRWKAMEKSLVALQLPFTRVEAVDGRALTPQQCATYQRGCYRLLGDNEIACFLSHRKCWEIIAHGPDPYGCVFEDDIELSKYWPKFLQTRLWEKFSLLSIEKYYPKIWALPKPVLQQDDFSVFRCSESNPGAAGYILKKEFAAILLKESQFFTHLVDSFLFSARRKITAQFGSFQLSPALCIQRRFVIGIEEDPAAMTHLENRCHFFARQAAKKQKTLCYYWQRAKIYFQFYRLFWPSKKVAIEFNG